ncbi:hypothetical protein [Paenibacillus wynnii]|uniref:Uncharacterized protein n=1 Tax=Paenibacillus wynnii TaxID=268407 RepID=A0A098MAH5_9BACL|nr:hypothetical protein [Paenibacillus wynnii]KGE18537.1 hypothetical protein PWYN_03510 [Paenibacillus wynnii]
MENLTFVNVNDGAIKKFLTQARTRIIFVKPAFYEWEVQLLLKLARELKVHCELYIEENDQAIRYGFGQSEAMKLIQNNLDILSLQTAARIHMAIIVVDHYTLFYMPKIMFLDEVQSDLDFPNGIYGDQKLTQLVLDKFPIYPIDLPEDKSQYNPFDIKEIAIAQREIVVKRINETLEKLDNNPPIDPNKLQRINFYRNKYKIIKLQLSGVNLKVKRINLNPFYKNIKVRQERLNSSWNVFSQDDLFRLEDMTMLRSEMDNLNSDFLINAGRFGYLLPIEKKKSYIEEITAVKEEFISFIKGSTDESNRFTVQKSDQIIHNNFNIDSILENSKEELISYFIQLTHNDNDFFNNILLQNRLLKSKVSNGTITRDEAIRIFIDEFVENKLKFPQANEILDKINITIDFYDISDELLYENEDFKKILNLLTQEVREYEEGLQIHGGV